MSIYREVAYFADANSSGSDCDGLLVTETHGRRGCFCHNRNQLTVSLKHDGTDETDVHFIRSACIADETGVKHR